MRFVCCFPSCIVSSRQVVGGVGSPPCIGGPGDLKDTFASHVHCITLGVSLSQMYVSRG